MKKQGTFAQRRAKTRNLSGPLAFGFVLLNACTMAQEVPIQQSSVNCVLFGDVYGKLVPGGDSTPVPPAPARQRLNKRV